MCWGLFVLVWLTGAIYNARRVPAVRERSPSISHWFIGIAAVLMLEQLVSASVWRPITVEARWLVVPAVAVLVVFTAFTLWARLALGTMWTSSAVVKDDHVLRTDGPYGITRHGCTAGNLV